MLPTPFFKFEERPEFSDDKIIVQQSKEWWFDRLKAYLS
jgi:hypothetical protein